MENLDDGRFPVAEFPVLLRVRVKVAVDDEVVLGHGVDGRRAERFVLDDFVFERIEPFSARFEYLLDAGNDRVDGGLGPRAHLPQAEEVGRVEVIREQLYQVRE